MADRLSALDQSFLYLEEPSVAMHTGALMVFDAPAGGWDYAALLAHISARIAYAPRYRQRLRGVPFHLGHDVWVDDERFDLSYHVRRTALPRPGAMTQLSDLVARIQPQPLDRTRPLWELYVVEGLARSRFALITKTHLAMVDGINAVDLAHLLLDDTPAPTKSPPDSWRPTAEPTALELISGALAEASRRPSLLMEGIRTSVPDVRSAATQLARGTELLWRAGTATTSYHSPINVEVGAQRRFAVVDTQLAAYRAIRTYYDHGGRTGPTGQTDHQAITVNDVVLAVLAGALRSWLLARGEDVSAGMALTVLSPRSVRESGPRPGARQTHLSEPNLATLVGVLVDLPVGEANAAVRLQHVAFSARRGSAGIVGVPAGQLADLAGYASGTIHAVAARLATQLTRRMFNAVVSNVPGPQQNRYVTGARMRATYPVVPLAPWQGLSVGITSYRGRIHFGLNADYRALPDLDLLAACVPEALAELSATVPA